MSTSYNVLFIANILSVVHAIQPRPKSSFSEEVEPGEATAGCFEARRSASSSGISWTPIVNSGRSLVGGAASERRSVTASGIFERIEMSYTEAVRDVS